MCVRSSLPVTIETGECKCVCLYREGSLQFSSDCTETGVCVYCKGSFQFASDCTETGVSECVCVCLYLRGAVAVGASLLGFLKPRR